MGGREDVREDAKEDAEKAPDGEHVGEISAEIQGLSIGHTEDTEQIVEEKDINDTIFTGKELKGSKVFLQSCEMAAEKTESDLGEYSILAPEVLVKRSTTKKA